LEQDHMPLCLFDTKYYLQHSGGTTSIPSLMSGLFRYVTYV